MYLIRFTNYMQQDDVRPKTSNKFFDKNPVPESLKGD